jgi:SlyX protein
MSEELVWRIDELQAQLTEATGHITALELAVYRQQQQLDLFQEQLRKLYGQLQSGGSDSPGAALSVDPREDIPPHY